MSAPYPDPSGADQPYGSHPDPTAPLQFPTQPTGYPSLQKEPSPASGQPWPDPLQPPVQQYPPMPSGAPYGYDPVTGLPYSDRSRVAAGLLSIFLGFFGVGRFYAGQTGLAVAQLVVNVVLTILTIGFWLAVAWIWPLIDGIVILAGHPRDKYGRPLR